MLQPLRQSPIEVRTAPVSKVLRRFSPGESRARGWNSNPRLTSSVTRNESLSPSVPHSVWKAGDVAAAQQALRKLRLLLSTRPPSSLGAIKDDSLLNREELPRSSLPRAGSHAHAFWVPDPSGSGVLPQPSARHSPTGSTRSMWSTKSRFPR